MYFVYGKGYWVECKLQDLFHIEIKCKTNLNLCMTKIHWNQIIHIHQNTSVYKQKSTNFCMINAHWNQFMII